MILDFLGKTQIYVNKKSHKIFRQYVIHSPFGISGGNLTRFVLFGVQPLYWQVGSVLVLLIGLYFILVNINDYNSSENIDVKYFSAPRHSIGFDYHPIFAEKFTHLFAEQFVSYEVFKPCNQSITAKIENSTIQLNQVKVKIELVVEKSYFTFFTDRERNKTLLTLTENQINNHDRR